MSSPTPGPAHDGVRTSHRNTEIVFEHGGTLMNIIDALIVMFGARTEQPDHAERSVACALALDAYAEEFRAHWRDKGVSIGVTCISIMPLLYPR